MLPGIGRISVVSTVVYSIIGPMAGNVVVVPVVLGGFMVYLTGFRQGFVVIDDKKRAQYVIRPPLFSLWKYRNLAKRSLVIGFVGPRGSGKSVGAARLVALDFMLRGRSVWSNMDIGFTVANGDDMKLYKAKSLDKLDLVDLDEMYENGLIYVDEVNLMMEARRAMAHGNIMFSYILQQLRKRKLTIIWSAQSEMHCDDRLRFQTDIYVTCEDISITKPHCGVGELSSWKAHDYSGIVKGKAPHTSKEAVFYEGVEWNKPWWNIFDTEQIQEVGVGQVEQAPNNNGQYGEEVELLASNIAAHMYNGHSRVKARDLWQRFNVVDRNIQTMIGMCLSSKYGIGRPFRGCEYYAIIT